MTGGRLMPTYARLPVTLVRGEGRRLWADDGTPYLDLLRSLGALSLGHAHPRWLTAVTDAARTIGLTRNLVTTMPQAVLADRLARGVLASTAGPDVVRCTPPFTIGPDEIDEGAKAIAAALEDVS